MKFAAVIALALTLSGCATMVGIEAVEYTFSCLHHAEALCDALQDKGVEAGVFPYRVNNDPAYPHAIVVYQDAGKWRGYDPTLKMHVPIPPREWLLPYQVRVVK